MTSRKRKLKTESPEPSPEASYWAPIRSGDAFKAAPLHKLSAKPFECALCKAAFDKIEALHVHVKSHYGKPIYSCTICGEEFASTHLRYKHFRTHSSKPYKCKECGLSWEHQHQLNDHMRKKHGQDKDVHNSFYQCLVCHDVFRTKVQLNMHEVAHFSGRRVVCEICSISFDFYSELVVHKASHSEPYACFICKAAFQDKASQIKHIEMHANGTIPSTGVQPLNAEQVVVEVPDPYLVAPTIPPYDLAGYTVSSAPSSSSKLPQENSKESFKIIYVPTGNENNDANAQKEATATDIKHDVLGECIVLNNEPDTKEFIFITDDHDYNVITPANPDISSVVSTIVNEEEDNILTDGHDYIVTLSSMNQINGTTQPTECELNIPHSFM